MTKVSEVKYNKFSNIMNEEVQKCSKRNKK